MEMIKKAIKVKVTIFIVIGLIILTAFGLIIDSIDSAINNKNKKEITTHYENMIYKGGSLPLPYPQDYVVLTSYFNPNRIHPITGKVQAHKGVDIVSNKGTEILAVADGKVTVSGFDPGGYGNWVEIKHSIDGEIFRTRYGHMRDTPLVNVGDIITAGTVIGIQGNTGGSTGEHLHFEIRINGEAVNPLPYLIGKDTINAQTVW